MSTATATASRTARDADSGAIASRQRITAALLLGGVIAPAIYIATDVFLAMRWDGYSYRDQTISELNAIGAPTRTLSIVLLMIGSAFLVAYGAGIWRSASDLPATGRKLRIVGAAITLLGLFGFWSLPFASMHVREAEESLTDTLHILGLPVAGTLLGFAIGFGAASRGRWFRLYSIVTVAALIGFGAWAGMDGSRVADNLPTPWVGIKERASVYSYQLWLAVFALALIRAHREESG